MVRQLRNPSAAAMLDRHSPWTTVWFFGISRARGRSVARDAQETRASRRAVTQPPRRTQVCTRRTGSLLITHRRAPARLARDVADPLHEERELNGLGHE